MLTWLDSLRKAWSTALSNSSESTSTESLTLFPSRGSTVLRIGGGSLVGHLREAWNGRPGPDRPPDRRSGGATLAVSTSRIRTSRDPACRGEWRSSVAHLLWEQAVGSSNLPSPTGPPAGRPRGGAAAPMKARGTDRRKAVGRRPAAGRRPAERSGVLEVPAHDRAERLAQLVVGGPAQPTQLRDVGGHAGGGLVALAVELLAVDLDQLGPRGLPRQLAVHVDHQQGEPADRRVVRRVADVEDLVVGGGAQQDRLEPGGGVVDVGEAAPLLPPVDEVHRPAGQQRRHVLREDAWAADVAGGDQVVEARTDEVEGPDDRVVDL